MGKGGDVSFRAGQGNPQGDIRFLTPDGREVIVIHGNGSFEVDGNKVATDVALYHRMRSWFWGAKHTAEGNASVNLVDTVKAESGAL